MLNSIMSSSSSKDDGPSTSNDLLSFPSTSSSVEKPVARISPRNDFNEEKRDDEDDATSSTTHHPDEFLNDQWEVDMIQYCNFNPVTSRLNDSLSISTIDPKRMKSGAAYRAVTDKDTSEYKCFRDENKQLYRVGDFVYMELDPVYPYVIGKVETFKMKKGTQMTVKVTRLYRREDLIADSQALLEAERKEAGIVENVDELKIRELFPSDAHLTQSVAVLRGKCHIVHISIKNALQDTKGIFGNDVFFYCTSYYPDTGRLSACHPEIREGQKFQAVCPPLADCGIATEADRDQLVYKPGNMCAEVEETVVKFARTFRTAALLENPQINELERTAFQGDRVKIDALDCLTRCGYVSADAVKEMMNADKIFLEHAQFLSSDDTKKFVKGLRNYGKNFPKIVKEYLPSFSRDSLVHYYYWWKKSNDAFKPKKINGTSIKKPLFPQTKRPQRGANLEQSFVDYDSASEDEDFEYGRACHYCYSMESRDWHHSGALNLLLCTDCRQHFKRYGIMREVERPKEIPPSLIYEGVLNETDEGEEGVRTRASNRRDRLKTPNEDDRTPIKNGIDVECERRSTPQRSVKIQKRSYHPSSSSTDDPLTPKKAKESRSHKIRPIHQLALTNKLKEKQESVDSDDQIGPCTKNPSTSASDEANEKPRRRKDEDLKIEEDEDVTDDSPIEVSDKHNLREHFECVLTRVKDAEDEDLAENACSRTQLAFRCEDEVKWMERRRKQAELKQKQRREAQTAKSQSEQEKQRAIEQEQQIQRHIQQATVAQQSVMPLGMSRPPPDLLNQMRMPGMPPTNLIRPQAMSAFPPEFMALAATRPELLQALALQQSRPPMMMQHFGAPTGLPAGLNPAALMQNPSNALMYQIQSVAQQQNRLMEEQKRQQQLEQRERQQRDHIQQIQNHQLLMAMGLNPQMLGPGFPLGALPTSVSIPTSQQLSLQQQSNMPQSAQQVSQYEQLAQMFRSASAASTAAFRQQQENQHNDMMQLIISRLQQDQQRNQQPK